MRVHDSPDTRHLDVREQAANDDCDVRRTKNPQKMAASGSFFGQVLPSTKYSLLLVKHQSQSIDIAGILFSLFSLESTRQDGSKIHNGLHVFAFCPRTSMSYRSGENRNINLPEYRLPIGAVIFNL